MVSELLHRNNGVKRHSPLASFLLLLFVTVPCVESWGGSSNDLSPYSNNYYRDWLEDGSTISMKIHGCVDSFVSDGENAACMEQSSEDGTTYWYMMSNCKRANVAYSLYSANNCNNGNFRETVRFCSPLSACFNSQGIAHTLPFTSCQFVSTTGLPDFIYTLQTYDPNSPWANNNDDGNGGNDWDYDNIPLCEQSDYGYIGLGCSSGQFILEYFDDAYCLSPTGQSYDSLSSLNSKLSSYSSCSAIYQNGNDYNAAQQLVAYSTPCSSLDSSYCTDSEALSNRRGSNSILHKGTGSSGYYKSWGTKAKYVMGGLLLLAAFIMFTGILFTNRRRRRALLQRKFRQRSRSHRSRKSSKSRSKSRDGRGSSSSRRTKSRTRSSSRGPPVPAEDTGDGGVLT
jgi:hypothetical protein